MTSEVPGDRRLLIAVNTRSRPESLTPPASTAPSQRSPRCLGQVCDRVGEDVERRRDAGHGDVRWTELARQTLKGVEHPVTPWGVEA